MLYCNGRLEKHTVYPMHHFHHGNVAVSAMFIHFLLPHRSLLLLFIQYFKSLTSTLASTYIFCVYLPPRGEVGIVAPQSLLHSA